MTDADRALVAAFECGELDPAGFSHADHVRVAWALLGPMGRPFHEAYLAMRAGLQALVARAGRPERYNETVTLAFLALVHEELARTVAPADTFEAFYAGAEGRLDRGALAALYPDGALSSGAARAGLVLPTLGRAD
ncbi:hypothetical protein [Caulobacter sp. 17J80-11]|uniref:hypothetical protein n=1 Tax=Caulobacter sp. 17J80-11 TaxID=2763502 RepID=UPI0016536B9C|nr:hypothetical protein [Caulobacter sp. 17J80-11]MBC6982380.1 hypothetical protein [Caulobacter sp. 17J80-11]